MFAAVRPAGKIPNQEGVDISEEESAGRGLRAGVRDIFQDPPQLQPAKIGAQRQPGLRTKAVLPALLSKLRYLIPDPRVLPDNCIRNRPSGFPLPHNRGFTLIGDANCRQISGLQSALLQSFADDLVRTA